MFKRPSTTAIRCPRCRSRDLEVTEMVEVTTTWLVSGGRLDMADGIQEVGSGVGVECECSKCKHRWRVRGHVNVLNLFVDAAA